jgi:dethiobiotin synthase
MMRGLFVTGTDTGVGKTCVSAALMMRLAGHSSRYWKPVQTGIEEDDDTATVRRLADAGEDRVLDEGIRLPRPVSPHYAARLSGVRISLDDLLAISSRQSAADRWIVEGAGGIMVPINEHALMGDLMRALGMPVVLATRTGLGTINHTLLSIEALRRRSIRIAGVVMVGPSHPDNPAAIERYGRVSILGRLDWLDPLTPEALRTEALALDPGGTLDRMLMENDN